MVLSALLGVLPVGGGATAQNSESAVLFDGSASETERFDSQPGFDRERDVTVAEDEVLELLVKPARASGVDSLTLELFDSRQVTLTTTRIAFGDSAAAAEVEWIGEVVDGVGALVASASVVVHRDSVTGRRTVSALYQDRTGTIVVEPVDDERHRMAELDHSELPEFRDATVEASSDGAASERMALDETNEDAALKGDIGVFAVPPGGSSIRILVLYANGVPANTQNLVNTEIAWTNQALSASGVPATVSLAGFEPAGYTASGSLSTDINWLTSSSVVASLRNQFAADLVALVRPYPDGQYCGLGHVPPPLGSASAAFSVSALDSCHYTYTFVHEIGHNLGANHDPWNATGGTFSYSRGHCVAGVRRDVMSYPSPCGGTIALQFSNPARTFVGTSSPSGTAARDNARAISQMAWPVSSYRGPVGTDYIWRGQSSGSFSSVAPANQTFPFEPIAGDFDGDGNADVFWYEPGEAVDPVWFFNDSLGHQAFNKSVNGTFVPLAGDFDGDGRDDVFWYAPGAGQDYVWWGHSNRASFGGSDSAKIVNGTSFIPVAGDFDGDGYDDAFWYHAGTGQDYVWWGQSGRSGFGNASTAKTVNGTFEPASGDFNANGRDDLFWYAPGAADDYVWWGVASRAGFGSTTSTPTVNGYFEARAANFDSLQGDDIYWFQPG